MPVEIALNTPLADSLNAAIQPKLVEVGWGTGGADDSALAEYIILMLVNGKTEDEIASELAGDLLNLGPDDPGARDFAKWLFDQIAHFTAQTSSEGDAMVAASQDEITAMGDDQDTEMAVDAKAEPNVPTGPKAMRNGNNNSINSRGGVQGTGAGRRMVGQINRTLERPQDALHRTRGNNRIDSHSKVAPNGPRGTIRQPTRGNMIPNNNVRAASIAHGLATAMGGMPPMGPSAMNGIMPGMNGGPAGPWMAPGQPPPPMDLYNLIEQQNQMMHQMQHQLHQQMMMQQQHQPRPGQNGKPLFERVQRPHGNHNNNNNNNNANNHLRKGPSSHHGHQNQHHHQNQGQNGTEAKPAGDTQKPAEGEDHEMGQAKREPPNPKETVCKYNLKCTNKECPFVHQSPAAPAGSAVDVTDVCSFGAACKNHKCVGAHPSPASKVAHQSEQDCKFFPNCANPRCPFRHPTMPLCRNGADCSVVGCRFTHVKTLCRFRPCTNRFCTFKHEEGQRGTFQDKVWVAGGGGKNGGGEQQHVSDRKFADEHAEVEDVLPGGPDAEMAAEGEGLAAI